MGLRKKAITTYEEHTAKEVKKVSDEFNMVFKQYPDSIDLENEEIKCDEFVFTYKCLYYGLHNYYYFYIKGGTEILNLQHLGKLIKEGKV